MEDRAWRRWSGWFAAVLPERDRARGGYAREGVYQNCQSPAAIT